MKDPKTMTADELHDALGQWDTQENVAAVRAELQRRSDLAEKHEQLLQALPLLASQTIQMHDFYVARWGWASRMDFPHDGTPEGIADAIIAAHDSSSYR